jgi:hypothetical protein
MCILSRSYQVADSFSFFSFRQSTGVTSGTRGTTDMGTTGMGTGLGLTAADVPVATHETSVKVRIGGLCGRFGVHLIDIIGIVSALNTKKYK